MKSFEEYSCVESVDERDMYSELQAHTGVNSETGSSKMLTLVSKEVAPTYSNASYLVDASPTSTKEPIRTQNHIMLSGILDRLKMRVSPASLSEIDDNESDEGNGSLMMNWELSKYLETSMDSSRQDDDNTKRFDNTGLNNDKSKSTSVKHGNSKRCTACGQSFSSKASLQRHFRVHSGEKPYKCKICSRDFTQSGSLKRHLQTVHKNYSKEMQKQLESKRFRDGFNAEDAIDKNDKNIKFTSPEVPGSLRCQYCKMQFDNLHDLTVHEKKHTSKKMWYSCEHCGMCFSGKSNLNRHIPIHSVKTPYKCDACKITFRLKVSLTAHIRKCHDKASMLGYSEDMSSNDQYTTTRTRDQQLKPYKCEVCNKTFQLRASLMKHKVSHNFGKPLKCSTCRMHFKNTASLKNHLKTHEKTEIL